MKAVVTGGAGFIGSHLVDALLLIGYKVVVIDNLSTGRIANLSHVLSEIEFINSDISEKGAWVKSIDNGDKVFHLAALADIVPSIREPEAYYKANVTGTFNILQACVNNGASRLIYAASSSCYGVPDIYPTPETAEMRPRYPYALTKRLGEELVLHWERVFSLPAISLRFFNVFGTRSRTSGTYGAVLGVFLAQKLAGKPFTVVGDGNQKRDFTYVTDVVSALIAASKSEKTGVIYNVGSGNTVSINSLVEIIGGEKVFIPKRPGEPDITFADISAISRELNWMPKIKFEEGISTVLKNISYWQTAPVWTPESIADETVEWFEKLGK